jgi:hypothetical protein
VVTSAAFVARPGVWAAAGHQVRDEATALAGVTARLCAALAEHRGMEGNDNIGEAFGNGADGKPGFWHAADNTLTALAQMVNLLAQTGWGMEVSGANYAAAEAASTVGGLGAGAQRIPRPPTWKLPAAAHKLVPSDPPPPEWLFLLQLLARFAAGCEYPDGNFAAIATVSSELTVAGKAIASIADSVGEAAAQVTGQNEGSAADQFTSFAKNLVTGLEWLASQCQALASSASNLLAQKRAARIEFVASLVFLAAMTAAAAALSIFTLGGSWGALLAAVAGQGEGLRAMLIFALRMVIEGMVFSGGDDAIEQFSQMHEGLQKSFDEGQFWTQVGIGGVASAFTFGLGSGLRLGAVFSPTLATVTEWMESGTAATLATRARAAATRLGINTVTGATANIGAQAAFGEKITLSSVEDAVGAGLGMAVIGEGSEQGTRLGARLHGGRADGGYTGSDLAVSNVAARDPATSDPAGSNPAADGPAVSPGIAREPSSAGAGAGTGTAADVQPATPIHQALTTGGPAASAPAHDDSATADTLSGSTAPGNISPGTASSSRPPSPPDTAPGAPADSISRSPDTTTAVAADPGPASGALGAGNAPPGETRSAGIVRPETAAVDTATVDTTARETTVGASTHLAPAYREGSADQGHAQDPGAGITGDSQAALSPAGNVPAPGRTGDLSAPDSGTVLTGQGTQPDAGGEAGQGSQLAGLATAREGDVLAGPVADNPAFRADDQPTAQDGGPAVSRIEQLINRPVPLMPEADDSLLRDPAASQATAAAGRYADSAPGGRDDASDTAALPDGRPGPADAVRPGDGADENPGRLLTVRGRHTRTDTGPRRAFGDDQARPREAPPLHQPADSDLPREPVKITKVVEIDGDRVPIPRIHSERFKYGLARDVFGKLLPVRDGVPRADEVGQGAIGMCGRLSSLRASLDYLAKYRPEALDNMIVEHPDGTVTVRVYDVQVYKSGVALPTGVVYEVRMGREVPVRVGGGENLSMPGYATDLKQPLFSQDLDRPAYTTRSEGVIWPALWEKAVAAVTYHWSAERVALHAEMRSDVPDLRGFELTNKGTQPFEKAETLAQITGEPAYVITPKTAEEAVALWKDLTSQGLPAAVGLKSVPEGERNEYLAPGGFHAYDALGVVHGTNDDARQVLATFETASGYQRITDYGTLGSYRTTPDTAGHLPPTSGKDWSLESHPGSADVAQTKRDNLITDRVLLRNPHNKDNPKPIPVADLTKITNGLGTATIAPPGMFDYMRNDVVRVDNPAVAPSHADMYVYAEKPGIPLYDGTPASRQVIRGNLGDGDLLVPIAAVARTHPDLIDKMLTQKPDGTVVMRLHEDEYDGPWKVNATGRTFDLEMTPDLPVDPATGHTVYADAESAGASWAAFAEKGFAGLTGVRDKVWSSARIAVDRGNDVNGSSSDQGYGALRRGDPTKKIAETLARVTGQKTQVMDGTNHDNLTQALTNAFDKWHWQAFFRTVDFDTSMPDTVPPHGLSKVTTYEVTGVGEGRVVVLDGDRAVEIPVSELDKLFQPYYVMLKWPAEEVPAANAVAATGARG